MSISLKNHEDRIKALENRILSSGYSETILWSGNNWNNGFVATLSQSWKNFKILLFFGYAENRHSSTCYITSLLSNGMVLNHTYKDYGTINIKSDTSISFPDQSDIGIYKIVGLKIYYIFRYNIYKMLKLISPILKF